MRRLTSLLVSAILPILLAPAISRAQTSDTKPPTLVAFDFNPTNVDVTAGPQDVTVTARVTDDLSGAPFSVWITFKSPSGAQSHSSLISSTGGSTLDRTYEGVITIPQYVESGTWQPEMSLWDAVNNLVYLSSANLVALGFATDLEVVSTPDTTAPVVESAVFSPPLIDVSSADQMVTLDLRLTDDVSGVDFDGSPLYFIAFLESPSSSRYIISVRDFSLVSGTPLDGIWQLTWTIPQYSEAGTWRMFLSLRDNAGNSANVPGGTFEVNAAVQDLSPPVLTGLRFSPAVIDTSAGSANVTVSLDLTDDLSGVDFSLGPNGGYFHGMWFQSPSTAQQRSACCDQFTMTSGTVLSGTWEANIFFPQYSEAGTWKASVIQLTDHVRNSLNLNPAQLAAALLPTDLVVVRPSLEGDGTVGSGGGTVTDETYGNRAAITFPPGAVNSTTDAAIDVFPDPLAVPTPAGFQGPGTYFVNISLTPEPTYPFAPPGVTATLPLPAFLNPGTAIPLFFVNTTTGTLEPMPDATTGLQVIGTVNADGLSATFTGISHFSILVGLIPDVTQEPDGRMYGVGFIDRDHKHQHFVFRASQLQGRDYGRFEYWVNDPRVCRSDDDYVHERDFDGDHEHNYGRNHRNPPGHFEATSVSSVVFFDDPQFAPARGPLPSVDTVRFTGSGKWNGRSGYSFEVNASDQGEPGRHRDTFSLTIKDRNGNVVLNFSGNLDGGNIQSMWLDR